MTCENIAQRKKEWLIVQIIVDLTDVLNFISKHFLLAITIEIHLSKVIFSFGNFFN